MKPIVLFVFSLFALSVLATESHFVVRDSETGAIINASLQLKLVEYASLSEKDLTAIKLGRKFNDNSKVVLAKQINAVNNHFTLQSSNYLQLIEIEADNYVPANSYIEPNSPIALSTVYLDVINAKDKKERQSCDNASICGYVYDKSSMQAITGAEVELTGLQSHHHVLTDKKGRFIIKGEIEENAILSIKQKNYKTIIYTALQKNSAFKVVVDLEQGNGLLEKSMHHPLSDVLNNHMDNQWLQAKVNQEPSLIPPQIQERSTGAVFLQPPANIRVGFSSSGGTCCGSGCATSELISLETYVQHGLDNEWISSWQADSLKSGSIPYRSYGAWHALNPPYTGYDICAGPCCQAFSHANYTATRNAAKATNGIMLDKNGVVARSEYSAQNNSWDNPNDGLNCTNSDLSCGNGSVGSPSTGWPCLADPDSLNKGCFGHGRGMSQWGTQFQAQNGSSYADIVDFYYNASNNPSGNRSQYASTPLRLDMLTVSTNSASPNEVINLDYEVFNAANATFDFGTVLLGASIKQGATYYSDPANDDAFVINQSGTLHLQRPFQLPSSLNSGLYDVIVALYLDVNNDGAIQSGDWFLMKITLTDALTVLAGNDLIFKHGFE